MSILYLAPVGRVATEALSWMELVAARWFPFPTTVLPEIALPPHAWDPVRRQCQSVEILKTLASAVPQDGVRLIGVTEEDLSIPMLTFLFGQAQLDGPVALISLHRLRQEFYGMTSDEALFRDRIAKEMLHELGHTFGLVHCAESKCAMSLSTHIGLVDAKEAGYCPGCRLRLERKIGRLRGLADEERLADSTG